MDYSFTRYLAAKKSVDDRALNRTIWGNLARRLAGSPASLQVLEIGAGAGAMFERMLDWGLFHQADYTGIDLQPEHITAALDRLPGWAQQRGYHVARSAASTTTSERLRLTKGKQLVNASFEAIDLFDFIDRERSRRAWDLLVAHAFLDLLDLPSSLVPIFSLLRPAGLFYFTINFDGLTLLEPLIDPAFDELVMSLYHRTMDERLVTSQTGKEPATSGDSRTGRRLFQQIRAAGGEILEAGASDWVVFPRRGAYPADEAYFLHHILYFFEQSLSGNPELEPEHFQSWLAARHAQVKHGELIYIAHQLDFLGQCA